MNRLQMWFGGVLADFGLWLYWNAKRRMNPPTDRTKESSDG